MAKILLSENTVLVNKIVGDLPQFKTLLERVKAQYEAIGYGAFNDSVFKSLLINLAHPLLPSNPSQAQSEATVSLNETLRTLKAFRPEKSSQDIDVPKLELQYISYVSGEFVIKSEQVEEITERFARIYVDEDAQTALNNNLISLLTQINSLKANATALGLSYEGLIDPLAQGLISKLFIVSNNGSVSINQDAVNWALTYKK